MVVGVFGSTAIEFTRPEYVQPDPVEQLNAPAAPIGDGPSGVHVVLDERFGVDIISASRCANARGPQRDATCASAHRSSPRTVNLTALLVPDGVRTLIMYVPASTR